MDYRTAEMVWRAQMNDEMILNNAAYHLQQAVEKVLKGALECVGVTVQEMDLYRHTDTVNELLARYGVKFGIYKNNEFKEQLFPFDAIPRVIEAEEFTYLEKGLKQRVMALNLFIKDIYSEKKSSGTRSYRRSLSMRQAGIWRNARASCRRKVFTRTLPGLTWCRARIWNGTYSRITCVCRRALPIR